MILSATTLDDAEARAMIGQGWQFAKREGSEWHLRWMPDKGWPPVPVRGNETKTVHPLVTVCPN